jgi:hypothetical protein
MCVKRKKTGQLQKKILFVYNTARYLHNFRLGLMLKMKEQGWQVVAVSPYDDHAEKIENQGIRFQHIPLKRKGKNPFIDLWLLLRLAQYYRKEKPAIIHHFTIKPVIYGSLAARVSGVPGIVNLIPGLGYVFSRGGFLQLIVERMYRLALFSGIQVIFQNGDDLDYFVKKKWSAESKHI